MGSRKRYDQFCALARALDRVGDRWTLLIIRELLIRPRSFKELQRALPGISPNLLVERMRSLIDDGLVARNSAPVRSKAVVFQLTAAGLALETAVFALIRWGARWMTSGPGDDYIDPAWSQLALQALLDGSPAGGGARQIIHVDAGGEWLTIRTTGGQRHVEAGRSGTPAATMSTTMPALLAVAAGYTSLDATRARIDGERAAVEAALAARTHD